MNTILTVSVPRTSENSPEQTAQLLTSLSRSTKLASNLQKLLGKRHELISLEVWCTDGQISFNVVVPQHLASFAKSQLTATYPDVVITETADLPVAKLAHFRLIRQAAPAYFPLRDYADYKQVDPMLPLLGVLAATPATETVMVQFVLSGSGNQILGTAQRYITPSFETTPDGKPIRELPPEERQIIKDKISHPLVNVSIRIASSNPTAINDLLGAISVLNRPDGNSLVVVKLPFWNKTALQDAVANRKSFTKRCVLNVMELASLWHLPGVQTKIDNIVWADPVVKAEAPSKLPTEKSPDLNIFAATMQNGQEVKFGLKTADRLRHMYIIGKTGTGKSTLLENLIIDDFKKGRGAAFIDPHGDSAKNLLDYIPKDRINDVVYFDPSDREHPVHLNILEALDPDASELVVSGIISIFQKLYGKFWGPRMQYILRNALLTLVEIPGSILPDVVKILSDSEYRQSLYPKIANKSLLHFWKKEFDTLEDDVRLQYTYPILNKIGQFVNSPLIQPIINSPKSSIDIGQMMDRGKILIANLSQGRLGQDNATLLGAMLITKFELATLARIDTPEDQRKDYFLYVDEFQNFATESFVKILSEARKFHLGLVLANQYIGQLPEPLQKAVFGNVGSLISFAVGSEDAFALSHEFSPSFTESNLTNLDRFQIALKATIDGKLSQPFSATTLPPFASKNTHAPAVLEQSRRRHSKTEDGR